MTPTTLLIYLILGLGAIGVVVGGYFLAMFIVTVNKMVTDEMRARIDDVPALLVGVALRLAPAGHRNFLREDWVDNLLVAFDEETARYPMARLVRSLLFVLPLFGFSAKLRWKTRALRRQGEQDEQLERLLPAQRRDMVISPAPATATARMPEPDVIVRASAGQAPGFAKFKSWRIDRREWDYKSLRR